MPKNTYQGGRSGGIKLLLALILVPTFIFLGMRFKSMGRQFKAESDAIFASERKFSLDNLENLGDQDQQENISRFLSGFPVPEKVMSKLRQSFFSPYFINEAVTNGVFPSSPMNKAAVEKIWSEIPDAASFPEKLLAHLSGPALKFDGSFPASATVIFIKTDAEFSKFYEESLLWYLTGRVLMTKKQPAQAFRAFTGIIDLAVAYENIRFAHPDKERRFKSCILREIAYSAIIEAAPELFSEKETLLKGLQRLKNLEDCFLPIRKVLAFDKRVPIAFGAQLDREVSGKTAEAKYKVDMTKLAEIFGDKAAMEKILDPLYDPLIKALEQPYAQAQRSFNSFNAKYAEIFGPISPESPFAPVRIMVSPDNFFKMALLDGFSENLPFHVLIDLKARQLSQGAQAALALYVFKTEGGSWPSSLKELQTWLGQPLPLDLVRGIPLRYKVGDPPHLASIGRDGRAGTPDDLVFVPFGQKVSE